MLCRRGFYIKSFVAINNIPFICFPFQIFSSEVQKQQSIGNVSNFEIWELRVRIATITIEDLSFSFNYTYDAAWVLRPCFVHQSVH